MTQPISSQQSGSPSLANQSSVSESPKTKSSVGETPHVIDSTPPLVAAPPNLSRFSAGSLVIGLLLLGALGYLAWLQVTRLQAELSRLANENQQQQQAIQQVNGNLEQHQQTLTDALAIQANTVGTGFDNHARQIQQLQEQVQSQHQQLESLAANSREDWLLAEAEYLLKLANQHIVLERSPSNAMTLLKSADSALMQAGESSGDAGVFPIREALADELVALKMVPPIDREGMYLQLNSLAKAMADLPRVPSSSFGNTGDAQEEEHSELTHDWWQQLWSEVRGMFGVLNDYIRIETVQAPAKPLVDQYTTQAAVLNVRLLLEQAQVALLKEQPLVYQQSLQEAQALLGDYFIVSPEATEMLRSLRQVEQTQIAPVLPDISTSLERLQAYLQQRQAARGGHL